MPFPSLPTFTVSHELRRRFVEGELVHEWAARYPHLFDRHERQTALNQLGGHFPEWAAAVHLYGTTGWLSLVESYYAKSQIWKPRVLEALGAHGLVAFFREQRELGWGRMHPPDLLVYAPDFSDYFYCEVKGPRDSLSERQDAYFSALSAASGKPVYLLDVVFGVPATDGTVASHEHFSAHAPDSAP